MPQFELPAALEAVAPPEMRGVARDEVRMLVSNASTQTHELASFRDFPDLLSENDLLVVNDSQTIAAALDARSGTHEFALHLSTRVAAGLWIVEPRTAHPFAPGEVISLPGAQSLTLLTPLDRNHARLWYAKLDIAEPGGTYLERHGRPIAYGYVQESWPLSYYQTIFARRPGSVEMPSAGRPFTLRTLDALQRRGTQIVAITLHCGVASPERHERPLSEWMEIGTGAAARITAAKRAGKRIVAIGTTVVRALETAIENDRVTPFRGWTDCIVTPEAPPRMADALLTGLHEPRASHLDLLQAFAPPNFLEAAYEQALAKNMLWHEFGDVHFIA